MIAPLVLRHEVGGLNGLVLRRIVFNGQKYISLVVDVLGVKNNFCYVSSLITFYYIHE